MNSISRHTFLTRSYILSLLNSSAPPPQQSSARVERHDLLDHPSLQTATKCCVFIKAVGRSMGFPTRTINTAQLLVHRTYIYRPQPQATATDIATACLFVAAKMEETLKKLRDILVHAFIASSQTMEDARTVPSSTIDKMRPGVLASEQFVLDVIGYDFRTTHPHLLLGAEQPTVRAAWTILADCYYTTLPVQFPTAVLAAGALCLAWNLDCETPQDASQFVLRLYCANTQTGSKRAREEDLPAVPVDRPTAIELSSEWWTAFGVSTSDLRSFVRQMVDFHLLFFTNIASAQYAERYRTGPAKQGNVTADRAMAPAARQCLDYASFAK
ncbi:hypothetical protein DL89DRAFT_301296 [Linderina pennispora]|uniref:Cyclin-like domain-containing protein n=1 Tax=Linderina pennispora TaxID=61395 RepID=A0A1Y1WMX1_9FUNG|nr:uncharacterized protein DL89DRAFT_301296 [Linderina pennispora]ORX74873.1 hypothetical protein DL89DRAFT_301296 [Linderina pennispora]